MGATTASGSLRQRIVSHPAPSGTEVRSPPAAIGLLEVRLNSGHGGAGLRSRTSTLYPPSPLPHPLLMTSPRSRGIGGA